MLIVLVRLEHDRHSAMQRGSDAVYQQSRFDLNLKESSFVLLGLSSHPASIQADDDS